MGKLGSIGVQLLALVLVAACPPAGVSNDAGPGPDTDPDGSTVPRDDSGVDECFGVAKEAEPGIAAADIIIAIDTSGSMGDETGFVRAKMNDFSQQIIDSGIDVHVVMLAESQLLPFLPGICVDAPLGSGACPADEQPPTYHHPTSVVDSDDALSVIVDVYPSYGAVLRQGAKIDLIIITDDNATPPAISEAQTFIDTLTALDPAKLTGFTVHAIYCFDGSGDCQTKGQVYEDLIDLTGGIHGNLALQEFGPVFDAVAEEVIEGAGNLPCEFLIPPPPEQEEFDAGRVNVKFTDGDGLETTFSKVVDLASCDPIGGGWYYDDDSDPSKVILCPASCDVVSADENGKIDIVFGCKPQID